MRQLVKELNMLVTTNAPSSELGDSGIAVTLPGLRVISAQDLSEDVLKRSGIERGMRVLELECGTGSTSLLIARLIGPSGLVVGVDRSAQAVDVAEKRATVAGYCYWTRFVTADPNSFVPDERFDAVVVRQTHFHQGDRAVFLRLSAYVHPGGVVLLVSGKPAENRRNVTTIEPSVGPINRHSAWVNEWWSQNVVGIVMAFVFSGLAPALLMTAIWSVPGVAPIVFSFTLAIALGHAVPLGLPIFLIFKSRGWGGATASVVVGLAIGAVPAGILSFPVSGFALWASAWAGGTPAPSDGLNTAALWVGYVQPLVYFGLLGAFGGIVFWAVLTCSGYAARHVSMRFMCSAPLAQRRQSGRGSPEV
jgi:SAM-dependent methyltransferase